MSLSRPKRSRYQNKVGISGVSIVVLLGVVGLGVAFGVAHMKNLYHDKEGQKLALREEIAALKFQSDTLGNEYLAECSMENVRARIVSYGSRLREIPQGAVTNVDVEDASKLSSANR